MASTWLPGNDSDRGVVPALARPERSPAVIDGEPARRGSDGARTASAADPSADTAKSASDPAPSTTVGAPTATRGDWPALSDAARRAWLPPPPPPPPPAPPPAAPGPPPTPAFPYQWIGQIEDEHGPQLFLAGPHRTLAVRVGEEIDRRWRVDSAASGRLQLTWLATGAVVQVVAR